MNLIKTNEGCFSSCVNDTSIILYLSEDLLPDDDSLEKLSSIAREFNVHKQIISLPDLHFKVKNFVPSGMTIPLNGEFSPKLLGPNNDGMGALKLRIRGSELNNSDIQKIFTALRENIVLFRRDVDIIDKSLLKTIFMSGVHGIIEELGFKKTDLDKFEDKGCTKKFTNFIEVENAFPDERSQLLPEFVPNHDIFDRGKKCIGTLDGTSHFIELFKVNQTINKEYNEYLDIDCRDYFFLVHAGSGDIGIISHRAYLNKNSNKYNLKEKLGINAFNALAVAGNYGYANRLYIYKIIKEVVTDILSEIESVEIFSDVPHDYLERSSNNIFIHRKGAVKLSPANCFSTENRWSKTGTPYIFPSCVGGDAYIVSNSAGNQASYYTTSHGAGRLLRKDKAINKYKKINIADTMKNKIMLFRYGVDQIEGQNPLAFKDVDKMLKIFQDFNLAYPVTKLQPLASLKA